MNMSNVSVKARLLLTIGSLAVALLVVGLIGVRSLQQANVELEKMHSDILLPSVWVGAIANNSRSTMLALDDLLMSNDADAYQQFKAAREKNRESNNKMWASYLETAMSAEERQAAEQFDSDRRALGTVRDAVADAAGEGKLVEARKRRLFELRPLLATMMESADRLQAIQEKAATEASVAGEKRFVRATIISWSAIAVGFGVAAFLGWLLATSMTRALNNAVAAAEGIAQGKLGQRIDVVGKDEFARLLGALKNMDSKLGDIVGSVRQGADAVGSAARQISHGNDDLSQRTQEQASALEETASSMEEMTATVKQNADNARQASQLASGAREQADRGGTIVGKAVGAMGEINESSRRIADIINVIDEIAFQTNLLALNAAVEAARAGEQGRGFAVVATEVRSLAQRSATAAKEIKELINDSVGKVQTGANLVDESGKSLQEIVASVKRVADIVAEISAASEEQASGIDQVNRAVTQMDSVTQQNAALVEEASAASKSMEHQATLLIQQIAFFSATHAAAAVAAPTAAPVQRSAQIKPLPVRKRKPSAPAPALARASGSADSWQEF